MTTRVTHPRLSGARPNLEQVGAHAGVSRATVSRVVNGSTTVAADLRARVERSIVELGYQPNRAARTLVTRMSALSWTDQRPALSSIPRE